MDLTRAYAIATASAAPALRLWLKRRLAQGKETADRLSERFGIASHTRPPGPLLWIHGASVGEARSAITLIDAVRASRPGLNVLITTGTVTSAAMIGEMNRPGLIHQFVPLDVPAWIESFLDHWRPDAGIWLESELWPNLVRRAKARGVKLALVNGRLSDRSFRNWTRMGRLLPPPALAFDPVLAQSEADAARFRALGVAATCVGNLKYDGATLNADPAALAALRAAIGDRPTWLASSTHPGEEEKLLTAHAAVRARHDNALLIIVPRHATRGAEIAALLTRAGFAHRRRASGEPPGPEPVYLADTMGELGLFYRVAQVCFIGKSLLPLGGQNPLEPARLDCPILFGPHMTNFRAIVADLLAAGGAREVADEVALGRAVADLLADAAARGAMARNARAVVDQGGGAARRMAEALGPMLAALDGASR